MLRDLYITYRDAFRLWVRCRTRPMTIEEAEEKRLFWAKCYALSAVFLSITFTYLASKGDANFKSREGTSKEEGIIEKLSDKKVRVVKFVGFQKADEYIYDPKTKLSEPLMDKSTKQEKNINTDVPN